MNEQLSNRLKEISERLKKEYGAEKVILYGSYAKGEETPDSEVDLFIVAATNERFFERVAMVSRLIRDLSNGLPVSPIVLAPTEVDERKKMDDQFVTQILEEGVYL